MVAATAAAGPAVPQGRLPGVAAEAHDCSSTLHIAVGGVVVAGRSFFSGRHTVRQVPPRQVTVVIRL